jgi:WD40 repeat protein
MSNFVLSGSADATVKLWDARTGLLVRTFVGHENAINGITFNPTVRIYFGAPDAAGG